MDGRTTLILIRHAESECSQKGLLCGSHDVPLNAAGRAQVERLRTFLARQEPASAIYSSPLQRALQTAAAARAHLYPKLRVLHSLREIDCGVFEGWLIDRVRSEYPELWSRNLAQTDAVFRWPGGESYAAFRRRVLRILRAILRRHPGERVLIFTHAGVISQILGSIHGQSAARWEDFRPGNAAITRLLADHARWIVQSFDERDHLGA